MPLKRTREGREKADGKISRMPPALKWPQRRATIGRAALCVRAALGVWLGGGRAAAPAASLGGLVRAFARPPAFLALARCALCSLAVCAFAQGAPARRACVLPPVAAVVRGLRVGRARAVAFCSGVFLRWRPWGGGLTLASCFRPACAVAVRLAAVSPSAGVVAFRLGRGAVLGGSRARWPSFPASAWAAWPLAALCFASPRRAVVRLPVLFRARGAPPGAVVGGCSGVWSGGGAGRCARFRVGSFPFPRRAHGALPPSPLRASPFGGRTRPEILAGAGAQPPASFGRWPKSVARGARALPSPLSLRSSSRRWRARSACRAVCALPRLRAAVAPVVWLAGRGGEGCCILQRRHAWGTSTRLPALRSPPIGGDSAHALHTKFCVQKIPGQKNTGRGRRGTAPARKTGGMKHKIP